jgi:tetratricopeptide (TPR) repeat protein
VTQGDFSYVLTARQMGKSSLMVRIAARLRAEGRTVAVIDLTALGQNLTPEQWYEGLLGRLGQQLDLEDALDDFWQRHERLGPLQRWIAALREVVLTHCTGPVVLFVDEIDYVRSLPFSTDEFFAAIRECYNRRTQDPTFTRLTFCLLGVATPAELIRDPHTTPFNIGRRIALTDFSATEAAPLARGFGREAPLGNALLARILDWTGGHPYLTQRLCHAVAEDRGVCRPADVDRQCAALFLSPRAREQDDNLLFVRERLLRSDADRVSLLELYAQVHRRRRVRDDDTKPLISLLHLAGIVRVVAGYLRVRNRIYFRVFDRDWIRAHLPPRVVEADRTRATQQFNEVHQLATTFLFELHEAIHDLPGATPARAMLVQRALASLESLAQEAPQEPALQLELAVAYQRVADVQGHPTTANLGDSAGALESYRKALTIAEALVATHPTYAQARHALAVIYQKLSDMQAWTGDVPGAVATGHKSLALFAALAEADPKNVPARQALAQSHIKLGDVLGHPLLPNAGDLAGALRQYRLALELYQALAVVDATNLTTRRYLGLTYERLGAILQAQGEFATALDTYRTSLALREAFAADYPTHADGRRDLGVGYDKIGDALFLMGDLPGALAHYRQALPIYEALVAADPKNANARRTVAVGYERLAKVLAQMGEAPGALSLALQSLAIREALAAADPLNARFREELAQTLHRVAALSAQTGHLDAARGYTGRLIALQKGPAEQATATAAAVHAYARTLLTCVPADLQDPAAALRYAQQAVAMPYGQAATLLGTLSLAYHRTGDHVRAVATVEQALTLASGDAAQRQELAAHLATFTAALQRAPGGDQRSGARPSLSPTAHKH